MNILKDKFSLRIFNILLNPKEGINNKEFLIGITLLLLVTFYQSFSVVFESLLITGVNDTLKIISIQTTPYLFSFPVTTPFLTFIACIVLCYKRCIDLKSKIYYGFIYGVIIYFSFSFYFFGPIKLISYYLSDNQNIIELSKNYINLYYLFNLMVCLTSLFMIVYFSIKKGVKLINSNDVNSNYVLKLGALHLVLIGILLIISVVKSFLPFNTKYLAIVLIITLVVVLIYYFLLSYKQSEKFIKLFYFNLVLFLVLIINYLSCRFLINNTSSIISIKICCSVLSLIKVLFLISNISIVLLKTKKDITIQ